jgi:predicted RNA-binding Zn-ribbon protein involved in translation (DUF1610 family)
MNIHGAFRKGTEEYRLPSAVVRGEHTCPECGELVIVRRNKNGFTWAHRSQNDCLYYAPAGECLDIYERNHLLRAITKEYLSGNYVPRVSVRTSSLPIDGMSDPNEILDAHGLSTLTADPTDRIVFNYEHDGFVFDIAVVDVNGEVKTATNIYNDSSTPRDIPQSHEWIEYSSANL